MQSIWQSQNILTKLWEINKSTFTVEDFNIPLFIMNKEDKIIIKDTEHFINLINKSDLTDIYRTVSNHHMHIPFKCTWGTDK